MNAEQFTYRRALLRNLFGGHVLCSGAEVRVVPGHLRRNVADLRHHDLDWNTSLYPDRDAGMAQIMKAETAETSRVAQVLPCRRPGPLVLFDIKPRPAVHGIRGACACSG